MLPNLLPDFHFRHILAANSLGCTSTRYSIVVLICKCRMSFWSSTGISRFAHLVPKLRRRSCALAVFPVVGSVTMPARLVRGRSASANPPG